MHDRGWHTRQLREKEPERGSLLLDDGIPNSPKSIPATKDIYVTDETTLYLMLSPAFSCPPIACSWQKKWTLKAATT
jgi:hypothetical protein